MNDFEKSIALLKQTNKNFLRTAECLRNAAVNYTEGSNKLLKSLRGDINEMDTKRENT